MPKIFLMSFMFSKILIPNTSALPAVGDSKPLSMDMVVVFPAPLCPRSANI